MNEPSPRTRSWVRGLSIVAALCVGAGTYLAYRHSRSKELTAQAPLAARPRASEDSSDDVAVEQALRLTPGAAATVKSRWVNEVKGVNLDSLAPDRRTIFLRFANAERCTCGCGYTLAACRAYDASCEVSLPRVLALRDSVERGLVAGWQNLRSAPTAR